MSNRKKKWLFFILSILAYFVPYITVTICVLPTTKVATGYKVAVGMGVIFINAIPVLTGIFRSFLVNYPMFTVMPFIFCSLYGFFTADIFVEYVYKFVWIEIAFCCGMGLSCIFWHFYRKYAHWTENDKYEKAKHKP